MNDESLTNRVNLVLPLDMSIQIEKEIEKRGLQRAQFIREAIHEKLKNSETSISDELKDIKIEIKEVKHLMLSILDKIHSFNKMKIESNLN